MRLTRFRLARFRQATTEFHQHADGEHVVVVLIKSLWASVQGDPVFMRRVNGWFTIFWVAMIPVSLVTGWISSVAYVAALSLWALVSGHWSAWQAARSRSHSTGRRGGTTSESGGAARCRQARAVDNRRSSLIVQRAR